MWLSGSVNILTHLWPWKKTEKHFDKTDVEWSQRKITEGLHHVIIIKYYTSGIKFGLISKVI